MKTLLLGLSCLFVLASCTIGSETPAPNTNDAASGTVNAQYKTDLATASNKIKDTQEFADCMEPSVKMCVSSVGMQLAQKSKSTEFCTELNTPEEQDGCRFAVVMSLASEKNDPTACNTLSGSYIRQCTESIYRSQAVTAKDISLCNKLDTTTSETTNSGDTMTPEMMSNKKDECVFSVLMSDQKATESDCEKIQDKSFQDMCKSTVQNNKNMNSPE